MFYQNLDLSGSYHSLQPACQHFSHEKHTTVYDSTSTALMLDVVSFCLLAIAMCRCVCHFVMIVDCAVNKLLTYLFRIFERPTGALHEISQIASFARFVYQPITARVNTNKLREAAGNFWKFEVCFVTFLLCVFIIIMFKRFSLFLLTEMSFWELLVQFAKQ